MNSNTLLTYTHATRKVGGGSETVRLYRMKQNNKKWPFTQASSSSIALTARVIVNLNNLVENIHLKRAFEDL